MKKFLYLLTFILTLTSCSQDIDVNVMWPYAGYYQPYTTNANGQYVIGGYLNGQQTRALTRAVTTATYGDNFSVFGLANGVSEDSLVMNNYNGVFSGNTWGYAESLKYFDNFVPSYSFLGIIPQGTYTYDATNDAVEISSKQFSVDNVLVDDSYYDDQEVLIANTQVAKANYSGGASLQFKHINSKVGLYFTSNDPNTQIIDYCPTIPGVITSTTTVTPFKANGCKLTACEISDKDIDYINSQYKCSVAWTSISYNTSCTITGDLTTDLSQWLIDRYGYDKLTQTWNQGGPNWESYLTNSNQILVHIDKNGPSQNYYGYFVNTTNAQITTTTIGGFNGIPNILLLPATSKLGNGTDAVLSTYPDNVTITANIKTNNYTFSTTDTKNSLSFIKPTETISTTRVAAPMTWFTFPYNDVANVGYTLKISYIYKGTNVYDARVWIPASECQWQAGKYYKYIIQINGKANGHDTPNDEDGDDPRVKTPDNNEIRLAVSILDYESGEEYTHVIQ